MSKDNENIKNYISMTIWDTDKFVSLFNELNIMIADEYHTSVYNQIHHILRKKYKKWQDYKLTFWKLYVKVWILHQILELIFIKDEKYTNQKR